MWVVLKLSKVESESRARASPAADKLCDSGNDHHFAVDFCLVVEENRGWWPLAHIKHMLLHLDTSLLMATEKSAASAQPSGYRDTSRVRVRQLLLL